MALTQDNDPTGVATAIVAVVTPLVTVLALVLGWTTELSTAVSVLVAALVNGAVAVWAILRARKQAYAPSTVRDLLATTPPPQV
jgi:hypothetical protein